MGLATIDPHSQKEHTEIHKIPKFVVNQDSCAEIQRFKNVKINTEMYGHPDAVRTQHPDGHLFLCKVWHFQMAVSYLLYWGRECVLKWKPIKLPSFKPDGHTFLCKF